MPREHSDRQYFCVYCWCCVDPAHTLEHLAWHRFHNDLQKSFTELKNLAKKLQEDPNGKQPSNPTEPPTYVR